MKTKIKTKKLTKADFENMTREELEAHALETEQRTRPHYHKDEDGFLIQCYHVCSKGLTGVKETLMSPAFWIGTTIAWPFEHFLYDHVPPFMWIAKLMGH